MIKAVIFDCFGVLTSDGWLPFAEKYFGGNTELKREAHDLNKRVDKGMLGYDEFVHEVAKLAAINVTTAHKAIESNIANTALFDYISELKKEYKIGMLSNAGANWLKDLFTTEQIALFDATVLSFETGHIKPEPAMYHMICDKLEVQPNEAVFIDDIERYVTGATDIGMLGIWYKNTEQLKRDLQTLTVSQ
jgi:HAD superfamily hydrolase (TIGR01509 family)